MKRILIVIVLLVAGVLAGCQWGSWREDFTGPSAKVTNPPPLVSIMDDGKVFVPIARYWVDLRGVRHAQTVYVLKEVEE